MQYSIKNLEKSRAEISITIEKEEWDNYISQAYNKTKHSFKIPGFRPGKAPFHVFLNTYGKSALYEDAMDIALTENYKKILDENKDVEPVDRPDLDLKEVNENGLKAVLTVATYPKFKLAKYKGLKIEKIVPTEITEEAVMAEIKAKQEDGARWIDVTDRKVQNGDRVILDYSGSVDGVKFEGGTAEKQTLDIGSGSFIPGFEDQMIGMAIGEEKDLKVTFPKEYHAENLAGKDAVFAVKVHEIKVKELPALDDEFAKDVSEFDTLDALKADIKAKKEANEALRVRYAEDDKIIDVISDATKIDIPDAMIEDELDRMIQDFEMRMQYSGIRFEDYLKYTGTTKESMKEERKEEATKSVKTRLVLEAIIDAEKIKVEKEEMDAEIAKVAEERKQSVEEVQKSMNQYEVGRILNKLLADKLFAFLRENNKIA